MPTDLPPYDQDDALIQAVRDGASARLAVRRVPTPVVVLGRSSKIESEVYLDRCRADGVPVLRRRGGGCAVVLDPGNLVVSLALAVPGFGHIDRLWRGLTGWMLSGLELAGWPGLTQKGVSDIADGDRKVGGAAMYRSRGLVYYSTTLLLAPRVELMERYLPHPPREPSYRAGRSHRDFVGALGDDPGCEGRLGGALKPPRAAGLLG